MADWVSIANLVGSKLGADDQISAPDADTHLARSVRAAWNIVRRATLRGGAWNFAVDRAQLAALASPGVIHPWGYCFKPPTDMVRLVEVLGFARDSYALERKGILADQAGPLYIRYVADVVEPALWDPAFDEAFASRMAFQIADRITGDLARKEACWRQYIVALREAKRVDALENPPVPHGETEWETARYGR